MAKILRVLGKNMAVRVAELKDKTKGGLILTETATAPRIIGTVEAIGNTDHKAVNVGDLVMFTYKDAFLTPDKEVFIVPDASIIAVVADD